jgi:WbqC-like protein family
MARTVVITQSNYLPWRGQFDMMGRCDAFILYDIVQYTRRDWRNRNTIKTRSGPHWLTVPVHYEPRTTTAIDEVRVAGDGWADKHIETLRHAYRQASAFSAVSPWLFDQLRAAGEEPLLSDVNARLLHALAGRLGIATPITSCTELIPRETLLSLDRDERLLAICKAAGATQYLSGPAARDYLDVASFEAQGIEVEWMSYAGYRDYPQLWGTFEPQVSIVDLLLNAGDTAPDFLSPAHRPPPPIAAAQNGTRAKGRDSPHSGASHVCTES